MQKISKGLSLGLVMDYIVQHVNSQSLIPINLMRFIVSYCQYKQPHLLSVEYRIKVDITKVIPIILGALTGWHGEVPAADSFDPDTLLSYHWLSGDFLYHVDTHRECLSVYSNVRSRVLSENPLKRLH